MLILKLMGKYTCQNQQYLLSIFFKLKCNLTFGLPEVAKYFENLLELKLTTTTTTTTTTTSTTTIKIV